MGCNMKKSELIAKVRKPTTGLLRPRKEKECDRAKRENRKSRRLTKRLLKGGTIDE